MTAGITGNTSRRISAAPLLAPALVYKKVLIILTQAEQINVRSGKIKSTLLLALSSVFRQRLITAITGTAFNAPVSVMETAGEGGPYGMALLVSYMINKEEGESLPDYLDNKVFAGAKSVSVMADESDVKG